MEVACTWGEVNVGTATGRPEQCRALTSIDSIRNALPTRTGLFVKSVSLKSLNARKDAGHTFWLCLFYGILVNTVVFVMSTARVFAVVTAGFIV